MRFLFFSAQYLPTAGGVERFTAELGRTLVQQGHMVSVVTSALPGLPATQIDQNGVQIYRLPAHLLMGGRLPLLRRGGAFNQTARALWEQAHDFAVINTRFYPLSLWGAKKCHRRGIPSLVLEHGTKHLSLDSAFLNWFGNLYEHAMMKRVRRYCDTLYGISRASNEWLRHFGVEAQGVLYNAVDAEAVRAIVAAPPCHFRQQYGLPANTPLLSFVGRFIAEKGVWELLAAFALLKKQLPGACLIMAGDGPLLAEVREQNQTGVILTGQLSHAASIALMAQSDIFCLPTYSEGFSSTILEAAAAGCCIVTTPTGGSPELIQDQKSGILLRDIQPDTLAGVLRDALNSPSFRRSAGDLVQKTVSARFGWNATASHLVEIAEKYTNTADNGVNS